MNKKNNTLNESVVRRWGKLANMATLTESYLEAVVTEEEDEMEVELPMDDAADDMEADSADMEAAEEPSLDLDEEEIEQVAQMFFDTLAKATDKEIEVDITSDAAEEAGDEMADEDPAMAHGDEEEPAMYDDAANRQDEEVELDVVDDEKLTEAVLTRVIERLLKNK